MRLPSKVTSYRASILSKFPVILENLDQSDMTPGDLFKKVKKQVADIGEFVEILDCLYMLGKIEFTADGGRLHYVERNQL